MTLGRPKSDDSPAKYEETFRLFQLSRMGPTDGTTVTDELVAFLEWAIAAGEPGFGEGDIISVTALAEGVRKSRNTAGKSVEMLVEKGMLVQHKPKSPYQIVSLTPIFTDSGVVADEQISLTSQLSAFSHISSVGACELNANRAGATPLARFLADELDASHDQLVQEAAGTYWRTGHFPYYLRLRTVDVGGKEQGALLEITYLRLPAAAEERFREGVANLRDHHVTQISLYPLLEQCGLTVMRSGRSHVTVSSTPPLLLGVLEESVDTTAVDMSAFTADRALLKWTYGIFHPETQPMVTFSVCYVDTELLSIFIRNLDVELGDPG